MLGAKTIKAEACTKCIMNGPTWDEIVLTVSSTFKVIECEQLQDSFWFRIKEEPFKTKFVDLAQRLEEQNLVCKIKRRKEGLYIMILRVEPRKQKWLNSPWIPRILFIIVVGFVMLDGYYRTVGTNEVITIGDPLEMAIIYTVALLGILGVHELGHLVAFRIHKIKTTMPYFIPGVPIFGIPTFGALIMAKGTMINREKTLDVAIAGPAAGLVITMIVALCGASVAPLIETELAEEMFESDELIEWQFGQSLLMLASLELFEKGEDEGHVLMTPLLFAAWIGFFLTFANLMPAGQLDGGHLMRAMFGGKALIISTYVSVVILFMINLWFVALFILFISFKKPTVFIMDEITPLSINRKISYVVIMALAVMCAPIPDSFILIEFLNHLIQ